MPTIYDMIPVLEKELVNLLATSSKAGDGAIYKWEVTIFFPASNAFIHYLDGINMSLKNDNYISAIANLRGLIESLAAVLYDGSANLSDKAYDRFMKKGRLPKWDETQQKWVDLGARESIQYVQRAINPHVNIIDIYDHCCDMLHFSATHMSFLGGFRPQETKEKRTIQIAIGSKDSIPPQKQKEIIDLCTALATVLGKCIKLATDEKNKKKTSD